MTKQLFTRIMHKHDIEANWLKATDFVPMQGELIIYDDYYLDDNGNKITVADAVRFKIGDGITPVNELPFNVIQPDWEQNNESSPDFIKGRTHYVEKAFEDISWNGDTEGRDAVPVADVVYYKVSDQLPAYEDLLNSTILGLTGKTLTVVETATADSELTLRWLNNDLLYLTHAIIAYAPTVQNGAVFPSAGVYFAYVDGVYANELKAKEIVHKLDEKYLPDAITPDMILQMFSETGAAQPIADADNSVITTDDNKILIL